MSSPNEVSLSRIKSFLHSHLIFRPPYPTQKFTNQTIIVTGSNTGMGLEAARHFLRLDAGLVILAVRDRAKGAAARDALLFSSSSSSSFSSPLQKERVQVWDLDLASYTSVLRFAERANRDLERVDVLVSNAAMYVLSGEFRRAAGQGNAESDGEDGEDEMTVRVNVVCTMMLAVLLLPKLRATSVQYDKETVCTFTGSFVHFMTAFPERTADDILGELAVKNRARMDDRYNVTKLMELLLVRQLAHRVTESSQPGRVTVSILNPGAVRTDIMREAGFFFRLYLRFLWLVMMRTAEEGGRTLVHAAGGGRETHGQYLDDCKIGRPSVWVRSEEGERTGERLWAELSAKLEAIQPGIMNSV